MKWLIIWVGIIVISISWYFWQPSDRAIALAYIQQEIHTYKSLQFSSSSKLIILLTSYQDELCQTNNWNIPWFYDQTLSKEKLAELIMINKAMLKSYVNDLQEYMHMKLSTSNPLVYFAYDKVVRLSIALAELEKNNELCSNEYIKKVDRMREITKQAIAHSKKTLRAYLYNNLPDTDMQIDRERLYLTNKMQHFIALDRILYL